MRLREVWLAEMQGTDHTPAFVRLVASVLRNVVIAAGILTYQ
jgi:hypothetical protein